MSFWRKTSWTAALPPLSSIKVKRNHFLKCYTLLNSIFLTAKCFLLVNGEEDVVVEDEDDEEELYELSSLPNGATSNTSSEADAGEEKSDNEYDSDASCSQSETSVDPQRAVIEDIRLVPRFFQYCDFCFTVAAPTKKICDLFFNRKSEFGVGVELTPEGQKLMQVHQDRLGRSLERLSTELYSKDTHFVLELIQVVL